MNCFLFIGIDFLRNYFISRVFCSIELEIVCLHSTLLRKIVVVREMLLFVVVILLICLCCHCLILVIFVGKVLDSWEDGFTLCLVISEAQSLY